jgi:hypothetical protein
VLRIPDDWNGSLVVSGARGVRKQYACDFLISHFVLARGFAYACTDKGNNGPDFCRDGDRPGDAVAEWHERVTQLTVAARAALGERFGSAPQRTYLAGISNGGYLVRWSVRVLGGSHTNPEVPPHIKISPFQGRCTNLSEQYNQPAVGPLTTILSR